MEKSLKKIVEDFNTSRGGGGRGGASANPIAKVKEERELVAECWLLNVLLFVGE